MQLWLGHAGTLLGVHHLILLVVQVLFIRGGILPFATIIASARLLYVVLLCMCMCCEVLSLTVWAWRRRKAVGGKG